jgi:hypothetical protein
VFVQSNASIVAMTQRSRLGNTRHVISPSLQSCNKAHIYSAFTPSSRSLHSHYIYLLQFSSRSPHEIVHLPVVSRLMLPHSNIPTRHYLLISVRRSKRRPHSRHNIFHEPPSRADPKPTTQLHRLPYTRNMCPAHQRKHPNHICDIPRRPSGQTRSLDPWVDSQGYDDR